MRAVFDANVVFRALAEEREGPLAWFRRLDRRELDVSVPDLLFAEVGHAFVRHVRAGRVARSVAVERLEFVRTLPFDVHALGLLSTAAVGVALERGLTVYDACYAVLAEAEGAVLVTGDRALAAAVARSELVD